MEILLDVVMEKNSLEEKTSLSTGNFRAPGPRAWSSPPPAGGGTCSGPPPGMDSTITTETNQVIGLFTCLRGCRRASDGTKNGTCLLTSHHLQEMMDEDLEKRAIEAMPVVSSLRFHAADAKNKAGYRANSGVAVSRWGPSACRSNVPRCKTAYVNLDD